MYCVDVLIDEHNKITEFIGAARNACCKIIECGEIRIDDFDKMLDFCKGYADIIHHGKEEEILFDAMLNKIDSAVERNIANNIVKNGMMTEHNLGRLNISELEKAIDEYKTLESTMSKLKIITNISAYCDLLERHILKENNVAYPFGIKNLSSETLNMLDDKTKEFENRVKSEKEKLLKILNDICIK